MSVELILGGARSGKSRLAEARAIESGLDVIYIADLSMKVVAYTSVLLGLRIKWILLWQGCQ